MISIASSLANSPSVIGLSFITGRVCPRGLDICGDGLEKDGGEISSSGRMRNSFHVSKISASAIALARTDFLSIAHRSCALVSANPAHKYEASPARKAGCLYPLRGTRRSQTIVDIFNSTEGVTLCFLFRRDSGEGASETRRGEENRLSAGEDVARFEEGSGRGGEGRASHRRRAGAVVYRGRAGSRPGETTKEMRRRKCAGRQKWHRAIFEI